MAPPRRRLLTRGLTSQPYYACRLFTFYRTIKSRWELAWTSIRPDRFPAGVKPTACHAFYAMAITCSTFMPRRDLRPVYVARQKGPPSSFPRHSEWAATPRTMSEIGRAHV